MKMLSQADRVRAGQPNRTAGDRSRHRRESDDPPESPADVPCHWTRADLASGEGVSGALSGIDVVVHAASDLGSNRQWTSKARDSFRGIGLHRLRAF